MDRSVWEQRISRFQARARGYLVRKELRRARRDFEDIVKEIDGGLAHLKWVEAVISVPHFTDTAGALLPPCRSVRKPSTLGEDVRTSVQRPTVSTEERGEQCGSLERMEAERDVEPLNCLPSRPVKGDGEGQRQDTEDASVIWTSPDLDTNYSQSLKGPRRYCLAQDVPRNPEALRLHRNNLTMELLWIQQAINSRKKYLSLKNGLGVSRQQKRCKL